jgi:6-phosphofructokinase 1
VGATLRVVYLPIAPLISRAREVDPTGRMWERLRLAINQPVFSATDQ